MRSGIRTLFPRTLLLATCILASSVIGDPAHASSASSARGINSPLAQIERALDVRTYWQDWVRELRLGWQALLDEASCGSCDGTVSESTDRTKRAGKSRMSDQAPPEKREKGTGERRKGTTLKGAPAMAGDFSSLPQIDPGG